MFANIERMLAIAAVMVDRGHDGFPALEFDLPAGASAAIVVGRHLRQNAVAQAERRVAETFQTKAIEKFLINRGAGDDDLGAARSDAFDFSAFGDRLAGQAFG